MKEAYVDLVRQVLDHQIIDADRVPCGVVDDLALDGGPGDTLVVTALLVGPGAWANRLPAFLVVVSKKIFGSKIVRVPWSEVAVISETVQLKSSASALGLGAADRKLGRWIARIPGA